MKQLKHLPVMLNESISALQIQPHTWYVDATFGQGGHTQKILNSGGKVIAFDYDQSNIQTAQEKFATQIKDGSLILIRENFNKLQQIISRLQNQGQISQIRGILFDFGTTSQQLATDERGLSFRGQDQELDMRLDDRLGVKAKDLLAIMGQKQLQKIFEVFGGETEARKISKKIVELRKQNQFITSSAELAELVSKTKAHNSRHIHPATKVFQALRIAVNNELENIQLALPQALNLIGSQDKIVTIAFHEGEDRIVKHQFRSWEKAGRGIQNPPKALKPSQKEITTNPNSRSAKLRVFYKELNMSKQKICLAYYTMLGCLILTQVFYTLYQTSLLVAHGRREKDLENKQVRLLSQKQALQETLAINNSLLAFSESHDLSDYHAITQPILVEKSLSLAALN